MFSERFEELKHTGKLPSPSGLGMRLLMLTRQESCSIDEVAQLIQTDPALTGRVLKLANSVVNSRGHAVSTVREAAMRLGLDAVCSVGLGFSLVSGNRTGKCVDFEYDHYWSWSLACAIAAKRLSERMSLGKPSELFTCALLSKIGGLALASVHPVEYGEVLRRSRNDGMAMLERYEREHFAIDNRQITAALMSEWSLPTYFGEVAAYFEGEAPPDDLEFEETAPALNVLTAASSIAEICAATRDQQPLEWKVAQLSCANLGLEAQDLTTLYDETMAEWQDWGGLMHVPTPPGLEGVELKQLAEDVEPPASLSEARMRILAVDDDPVSLRLLVAHLERGGHQVVTARNGMEALAVAVEWNPQMVITDWMMPEMDGLELCKRLRSTETGRNLYILILTGRTEEERIVEAFEAGADDYIVKPFSPRLLLARTRPGIRVILLQEENERHLLDKQQKNAKLEIAKRKLKAAAMTDSLTDLPNRRYAMKRLDKEWANSSRSEGPLSAIILDIDHFKKINDTYGHDIGDVVLWSTARAIHRSLRRGDQCARIGGEEFLVICPNTDMEGADQLAERIRLAVEQNHIDRPGFTGSVTISLGVGCRTPGIMSVDELLKIADRAVYRAKHDGRNRVVRGYNEDRRRSA